MPNKLSKYVKITVFGAVLLTSIAATDRYFEITKHVDIFVSVYKEVDDLYVDEINHAQLMRSAMDAMLSTLDPYTVYYSESEIEDFKFQKTGKYGGIGARVGQRKRKVTILEPYKGYPADKAGLLAGDIVLEIDGKVLDSKNADEVSSLLKGEPNSKVKLKILRGQKEPFYVDITREEIKVDNVSYAGMLNETVGYVRFDNFRENAGDEVKQHMEELKKQGMKEIVLDMRGNPGGLLHEAVNIVNLFVGPKEIVVTTKGKHESAFREYKTQRPAYDDKIPLVVLVDGHSASASEIVSGALQDLDRAVVIGKNSYGKGLVQVTRPISYNTQLKVTTSKYYIPSGRCIQRLDYGSRDENGVVPEVPDSLIQTFRTRNGREVKDGAGIDPDITTPEPSQSEAYKALTEQDLYFDFATNYRLKNASLPENFEVDDALYNSFMDFINSQGFSFETKTEKQVDKLKDLAEQSGYLKAIETNLEQIKLGIETEKKRELTLNKERIKESLRLEIVIRYQYENGRAKAALEKDEDIKKSLEVLTDLGYMNKILNNK